MYSEIALADIKLDELEVKDLTIINLQLQNLSLQVDIAHAKLDKLINAICNSRGVGRADYDLSSCGKKLVRKKSVASN